jgi:uncharacterized protein YjcR
MKKNEDRKLAERTFLTDRGRITNKELASRLGVHPATVARWKKIDEWDRKLVQSVGVIPGGEVSGDDPFHGDSRHISLLNERIEGYLQKKELLPSEIVQLAQAKYYIVKCLEMMDDMRFSPQDFGEGDEDLD